MKSIVFPMPTIQYLNALSHFFFRFRIAKISHAGRTEVGKRADLLLFDENLSLLRTVVYGKVVFSNKLNETLTRNWLPQT